jgi:hypothetical protein
MKSFNIEELKELIPDYITGNIDEQSKQKLESAMTESLELRELYNELSGALAFVSGAKFSEPSPQYFTTLLPRIHERIEKQQAEKYSWGKVPLIWKMLVPVAAIILIAVVYYLVKPTETQVSKDDKKIENINKDTNRNKTDDNGNNKLPNDNRESLVKETPHKENEKPTHKVKKLDNYDFVQDQYIIKDSNYTDIKDDEVDVDESSPFSTGSGAGLDEDTENAIDELTDTEQNSLLKQLEKSNL